MPGVETLEGTTEVTEKKVPKGKRTDEGAHAGESQNQQPSAPKEETVPPQDGLPQERLEKPKSETEEVNQEPAAPTQQFNDGKYTGTELLLKAAQKIIDLWEHISYCLTNSKISGANNHVGSYIEAVKKFERELNLRIRERVIPPEGNPERGMVLDTLMTAACTAPFWTPGFREFIADNGNATDDEIRGFIASKPGWVIETDRGMIKDVAQIGYKFAALIGRHQTGNDINRLRSMGMPQELADMLNDMGFFRT